MLPTLTLDHFRAFLSIHLSSHLDPLDLHVIHCTNRTKVNALGCRMSVAGSLWLQVAWGTASARPRQGCMGLISCSYRGEVLIFDPNSCLKPVELELF